jgi:hypothetical protein
MLSDGMLSSSDGKWKKQRNKSNTQGNNKRELSDEPMAPTLVVSDD